MQTNLSLNSSRLSFDLKAPFLSKVVRPRPQGKNKETSSAKDLERTENEVSGVEKSAEGKIEEDGTGYDC